MSNYSSQSTLAPAEHQKDYRQGQIIKFDVPSFYGYIDPRQTFLRMNIELISKGRGRLSKDLGAQSLIHAIRIYDHSNAQLLENIENYGELVKVLNVYGENESIKHQLQLLEAQDVETANGELDIAESLFFKAYANTGSETEDLIALNLACPLKVQTAMKIHSGILGGSKVFPVNAFGGLRIEIELNRAIKSFMLAKEGSSAANPLLLGVAIGGGAVVEMTVDVPMSECPFMIGQELNVVNDASATKTITITGLEHVAADDMTKITFASQTLGASAIGKSVHLSAAFRTIIADNLDFKLSNVELCLKQVNPPANYVSDMMKQIGSEEGLNLDIKTYDLVRNNIQAGQLINEQPIRTFSERSYAIMSLIIPNDSPTILTDDFDTLTTTKLKKYSYAIDGKKNPNRDVNTELTTTNTHFISQQATFELQKTLESCGLVVRSLPVKSSFLIGRALGRYGGVFNLSEKNLTLRTEFNTNTESLMCLNYLCSLRRLNVSNKGITVIP